MVSRPRYVPPRYLTPPEAAAFFGITTRVLARHARAGHVPYARTPGGRRIYRELDLREIRDRTANT